jgi:hypothetical protein
MGWIALAQDGDQWRALVNTVINFLFHKFGKLLSGFSFISLPVPSEVNDV